MFFHCEIHEKMKERAILKLFRAKLQQQSNDLIFIQPFEK